MRWPRRQLLSTGDDDLWRLRAPDGRGIAQGGGVHVPFIHDKRAGRTLPDVMYYEEWPVRHRLLLFAGLALGQPEYLKLWSRLNADPTVDEVIRNFFIRQPLLWTNP